MRDFLLSKVGKGYIFGATGWICTEKRLEQQAAQYPQYADTMLKYGRKWLGVQCYDCAQLTKAAAKEIGIELPSGATSQWNTTVWEEKSTINDLPNEENIFLFRYADNAMQHVGITIGNGEFVDARSTQQGILRSKIASYGFTHWARAENKKENIDNVPRETIEEKPIIPIYTLSPEYSRYKWQFGDRGNGTREVQKALILCGYDLRIDGIFGVDTRESVKRFQKENGLQIDGVVGKNTWKKLEDKIHEGF